MNYEDKDSQDSDMSSHNTTSTEILSGSEKAINQYDLEKSRASQHDESDIGDAEPLIKKYNISNTSTEKKLSNYETENKEEKYSHNANNAQSSTSGNNASGSHPKLEIDVFDGLGENKKKNYVEVNPQSSTSECNASVSDSELEIDGSDGLEKLTGNNFDEVDNPTVKRPRRLMLNDDKKRIFKEGLLKAIETTKEAKRTFKRAVKRNVELGNSKYMPGPKSMTKDLDYHLQEQNLATRFSMPSSEGTQSLNIRCYQLNSSRTRVIVSWNIKMTPRLSKASAYEFYLCKEFIESHLHLSWTSIDQNELPKTLHGKCIIDVERGFTYHFGLRTVDSYGRRVPLSIVQQWI